MTPEFAQILADSGPWAVVIFLGGALILFLGREHLKADQDDRDQRDKALTLLESSLANNKAAIAAWDKRSAADAARHRRLDP